MIKLISSGLVALALVGCGGSAPGDADLRTALENNFGGKADAAKLGFASEIAKAKIIQCTKAEAGGYRCDFTSPLGSGSARFVKGDGGWIMMAPGS
jgi:hypothetical protein